MRMMTSFHRIPMISSFKISSMGHINPKLRKSVLLALRERG